MAKKTVAGDLDTASLVERLAEARQALFNLRFQSATGSLENSAAMRTTRREIARLETELRAREIEAAEALATEEKA
jgi:large subunit ribosomal protein L29